MTTTFESRLEISVQPEQAEQKFAHLYRLTEQFYWLDYSPDPSPPKSHPRNKIDHGIFGSRQRLDSALKEIKAKRKTQGYKEKKGDSLYEFKNKPHSLHSTHKDEDIEYQINELKIPFETIINENGKMYTKNEDSDNFSFSKKRLEIIL